MKTAAATRVHAVIPAAGRGVRFGSPTNKVFKQLNGRSIIEWTVEAFCSVVDEITVVAGINDMSQLQKMVDQNKVRLTVGGESRQESVWKGLQTVTGDETIVVVHDGARPLVSLDLIKRCISSAKEFGSGVAAVKVVDALKSSSAVNCDTNIVLGNIDREGVWAAQTPQAFRAGLLRDAHRLAADDGFIGDDEASLVQRLPDAAVHLVSGDRSNFKITTQDDLYFANQLMPSETRIGIGYDIHKLVEGRPLWLGGVLIPSTFGLDGHSDADVVLHAVCDSLLGAAGLPDIGHLFPNTDPQYRGISSLTLLGRVRIALSDLGWRIGNIDTMLIAERPRVAPFIPQMKAAISNVLLTSLDRVSVKATTNEGIGSLGAGDGIACHATAGIIRHR